MTNTSPPHQRTGFRRGAYILPSLFTMGNILLGFYAVVLAFRGELERAGWMIIIAGVLDGLDGRIARLTGTESEFGKEFDSLADVLTFGAAPAYLGFLWGLHEHGRVGWLVPLFFLLCTSVRLARFNVQTKSVDSRYFVGLPSPAAAAAMAALLWTLPPSPELWAHGAVGGALILCGSLMISTFRYPSFKRINFRRRWSYRSAMIMAVVLLVLTLRPQNFFQILAAVYVAFGPLNWLWRRLRLRGSEPGEAGSVAEEGDATEVAGEPAT